MKPVIYTIEFPDGASYVGSTTNFSARRTAHLRVAKGRGKPTNPKLTEHLRRIGAPRDSYRKWRSKLGSAKEALDYLANRGTAPVPKERTITANGVKKTLNQWARAQGLEPNTIRYRLDRLGWPPEQAVGLEPRPAKPKFTPRHRGIEYRGITASLAEHCRRLGLPYARTHKRYARGLPLDKVFAL